MRPEPKAEGLRWLRQAERDLDDARYMQQGSRYNVACFLAQQAAEKAVKAFLYAQEVDTIWGHSVSELCQRAAEYDPAFGSLRGKAASLDKFYMTTRYPNSLPGTIPAEAFDQEDATRATGMAEHILAFVRERVGSDGHDPLTL
ncbi:MAG: HEPN domain-containing protein [Chloroflexi bacterium]|nr:HEPN domain-containing protein [Chloroflexota bacterium]